MVHICDLRLFLYAADMTLYQKIHCPECGNTDSMKAGFTAEKKQGYRCRFTACDKTDIPHHFFDFFSEKIGIFSWEFSENLVLWFNEGVIKQNIKIASLISLKLKKGTQPIINIRNSL